MNVHTTLNSIISFCDTSIPQCRHLDGKIDSALLYSILSLRERAAKLDARLFSSSPTIRNLTPPQHIDKRAYPPLPPSTLIIFGD